MAKRKQEMQTIALIMATMESDQRKKLEEVMKRGLVAIGREKVAWKEFQVYPSSGNRMKTVLKDPAFMLAIIASLKEFDSCVNIAVMKCSESGVHSQKINDSETLTIVYISERQYNKLNKK